MPARPKQKPVSAASAVRPPGGIEPASALVPVSLGSRSYEILIGPGLLARAGALAKQRLARARMVIVTDETVAGLHLPALERSLGADGLLLGSVVLPPGEATKSFARLAPLCERLLDLGAERGDAVVALGGGVIGDIAAFAASILRRGVRLVQIPTTLLAQVDSSVGGKTGINTPQGKNLVGTFHQPSLVLADTEVLDTLPPRELRAGYAEVVKYGLIGDAAFFGWLDAHGPDVLSGRDAAARRRAIETGCRAKADIVARDETETGDRALLNLGHTFGHALEAYAGFSSRLLHGEAVAVGMVLAFRFSEVKGLCSVGTADRVARHLAAAGLPTRIADVPSVGKGPPGAKELTKLMAQDKKVVAGKPTLVLARSIGEAFLARDFGWDDIESFLALQGARS